VTGAAGKNITAAKWAAASPVTITGISNASNAVVTTSGNSGLVDNDWVYISGVKRMTQVNNQAYKITTVSGTKFKLNVSSSSWSTFQSGSNPQMTKCTTSSCDVTVTANSHGFSSNDWVHVENVGGLTGLNGETYQVTKADSNNLVLLGSLAGGGGTFTSGGQVYCTLYTCPYYRFATNGGSFNTFELTNCVTERTGSYAYTDRLAGPGAYAGYLYPSDPSKCVSQSIVPLTSNKTTLTAVANGMVASGSTAGHIGLAWAWYLIAPNFNSLWPSNTAGAYGGTRVIKAVILMTDGQFNTQYYNGVIAKDSDNNDGSNNNVINQNSLNGESQAQAESLCTAIKATGGPDHNTILFTVGFDIGSTSTVDVNSRAFLKSCATDNAHFYLAVNDADGSSLTAAFKSIAQNLSELRLSK
jgi:hypothetical protein